MKTTPSIHALEVSVRWGDTPLDQWVFRTPRAVRAGCAPGVEVLLPGTASPEPRLLAQPSDDGGWEVLVPSFGLPLGPLHLDVRIIDAVPEAPRERLATDALPFVGGTAAVAGLALLAFALTPPRASALTTEDVVGLTRSVEVIRVAVEPPPVDAGGAPAPSGPSSPEGPGSPEPRPGTPPTAPRPSKQAGERSPSVTAQTAARAGVLGVLAGLDFAGDADEGDAFSGLVATLAPTAEPGWGGTGIGAPGGLDMIGSGVGTCPRGSTDCGVGLIGAPGLRTRSDGPAGVGTPIDLGPHVGRTPPRITPLEPETVGVAPEVIRRVIHRNLNAIRFCFEEELRSHPDLGGRVSVAFTLRPDGAVAAASPIAAPALAAVGDCVARVVERLTFPAPGGAVAVTYPFVFRAAE